MEDGRRSDNQQSHLSFVSIFVLSFSDLFTDRASLCGDLCKYCRDVGEEFESAGEGLQSGLYKYLKTKLVFLCESNRHFPPTCRWRKGILC